MTVALYKWTTERYHEAIAAGLFDDQPVELLQGDLVLMPPEGEPHACYSSDTAEYLRQLLGVQVAVRETKPITLPDDSEPIPDLAIVLPPLRRYLAHHPYPADIFWLIEYSKTTLIKDLGIKKETYATAGIVEYWVVDLQNHQLKVFRDLINGQYQTELTLTQGTIATFAFPAVAIDVRRLFS